MFTGLIDDVGTVDRVARTAAGLELTISCRYLNLVDGESVAVNGVCLTVREHGPRWMTVAAVGTTLERTTLAYWTVGTRVNLERSLRVGDRMGGHIVQGHVDGVAEVLDVVRAGDALLVDIALSQELFPLMVLHGSVTVEGVSLTVNDLPREHVIQVSLIEYTLRHTTLGDLHTGARVHIEADVMGKYARQLLAAYV
jgi:riboflavin synthase